MTSATATRTGRRAARRPVAPTLATAAHDHGDTRDPRLARLATLQNTIGNRAVVTLLQRQDGATTTPGPAPGTPAPAGGTAGAPAPAARDVPTDPLADPRIAWIRALDPHVRRSIDKVADVKLERRIDQITTLIDQAKEAVGAAEGARATAAAERELSRLEVLQDTTRKRRIAFMDYMACTLGGDRGVQRYWESLVDMGGGLVVHPEVAIRLRRVEQRLSEHGIPMPRTTVGQSLRGDHTRSKRERNSPGMLAHAMGLAVDWFAFRNIHLKDERLRVLIETVTNEKPTMQLDPRGGRSAMVVALGRSSTDDTAAQRAFLDKVESEFDRLTAASKKLQAALPDARLPTWAKQWYDQEQEVARLQRATRTKNRARRAEAQRDLTAALTRREELRAELHPKLKAAFAPWRAAVAVRQVLLRKQAADLGWHGDLRDVSTPAGRRWLGQQVRMPATARRSLQRAEKRAKNVRRELGRLRGEVDAAARAVDGAEQLDTDRRALLVDRVGHLQAASGMGVARAGAVLDRTAVLLARDLPTAPRGARTRKGRVPRERDLARWERRLERNLATATSAEADLQQGAAGVPAASLEAAEERRRLQERDVEVRRAMGGNARRIARLQELKRRWLVHDQLYAALESDFSFLISGRSVGKPTPSVAQLLGLTPGTQGGGFFGAPAPGTASSQNPEGFSRLFFRFMASEGFDMGAAWTSGDAMHLEFEELQQRIVPPEACEEPPAPRRDTPRERRRHEAEVERRRALRESRAGFVQDAVDARARAREQGVPGAS